MQYYCWVLCHATPPRGAADNAPYPSSKFLFFLFFSIGVTWCFRHRCACFVFVLVGGGAADGLTEIIKHGV